MRNVHSALLARLPSIAITGNISRHGHALGICYELRGDFGEVVMSPQANRPDRRHGLWEATCFELFLAPKNSPRYWEFNLSPDGHWNVYNFQAYRQGMQEDRAFASLPCNVQNRPDSLVLVLNVDLAPIILAETYRALDHALHRCRHFYGCGGLVLVKLCLCCRCLLLYSLLN